MSDSRIDQATELRSMITRCSQPATSTDVPRTAQTIAVTSGKGGVGKSVIALNLAVSLTQLGKKVCLFDADLGLGNLDLMCGLTSYWNLSHVLEGSRCLREIVLEGPNGISILPGASGLIDLADTVDRERAHLLREFADFENDFDYLILDCGTGIHQATRQFAQGADTVLIVSSLEITSLTDTYAALKVYHSSRIRDVRLVFNGCETRDAQQVIANFKQTTRQYLQSEISVLGCVPDDEIIRRSITARQPAALTHPRGPACQAIAQLSRQLTFHPHPVLPQTASPFVQRLLGKEHSAAA